MYRVRWLGVFVFSLLLISGCSTKDTTVDLSNAYPWVIVEFDSLNRTPTERIAMLKELGFSKYAYDWNIENVESMSREFQLAKENNIDIFSVWFWLNAKRDSVGSLHESNERMLSIVEESNLETTFWLSFNNNFFEDQTQEESVKEAASIIRMIYVKAAKINCKVAIYNHRGWFGNPYNQLAILKELADLEIGIVYNFHHAHNYLDQYPKIIRAIKPYLISVNLNGMKAEGPEILPLGSGDLEEGMIELLIQEGYDGPWGILGHVRTEDVQRVLKRNILGYKELLLDQPK